MNWIIREWQEDDEGEGNNCRSREELVEEEIILFFWNLLNLRYLLDIQRMFKSSMEEGRFRPGSH